MIDASPSVKSLCACPYSIAELDAHPDSARIWATIEALKAEAHEEATAEQDALLKAANEAEQETDRIKESFALALDGLRFETEHDDEGIPNLITHNLVFDLNEQDDAWVTALESALDELLKDILQDHFED